MHPQLIITGIRASTQVALAALANAAGALLDCTNTHTHTHTHTHTRSYLSLTRARASAVDNGLNAAQFEQDLLNIARTTLSSKIVRNDKELFARLAVNAVLRLKGSTDLSRIAIIKRTGGAAADSYLDEASDCVDCVTVALWLCELWV